MTTYRASIFDSYGQVLPRGRYVKIEAINGHDTSTVAHTKLNGRGKFSEVKSFLAENGFTARGWASLSGAQEMRSMLDKIGE